MRTASSITTPIVIHKMYMGLAVLSASLLFLGAPRQAAAQNSPLRVLAERVLEGRDGVYNDRDGNNTRREREQWERERAAREAYCRHNRNDRRCDNNDWNYNNNNNDVSRRGAWCLDRDRNNRCDATSSRNDNGRHRGWDDDRKRGRKNGRR